MGLKPLQAVRAPPERIVGAAVLALVICVCYWFLLHEVVGHVESPSGKLPLLLVLLSLPLGTAATLALLIPLGIYVSDYAAFQNLNVIRPDHFGRLVVKVYRAWLTSENGKLSAKEL